ncbi:MAG: hypothetical protein WC752_01990 [Patescibacteria group bacterium]|jgi:hypothetical protein
MKQYLLLIILLFTCSPVFAATTAWPAENPGTEIGGNLPAGYEPSGVIWQSRIGDLFLVWDNGYVTQMDTLGNIDNTSYYGGDYEGITIADQQSNNVYIGVENPDTIIELDISTWLQTGKSWDLTTWMNSTDSNQGLEAIAFVPNGYHPYTASASGGLFYTGMQENGTVYVFDVDLSNSGSVSLIDSFTPVAGQTDISDVFFSSDTGLLYVLYDSANELLEINPQDKTIINEYTNIPGSDPERGQEGIVIVPDSPNATATVYFAYDTGGVSKNTNYPIIYLDTEEDVEEEEEELTISLHHRYLTINNQRIKVFQNKPILAKFKSADFRTDGKTEIIIAALMNKKRGKVITVVYEDANNINIIKKKTLDFPKNKSEIKIRLKTENNRFKTYFDSKKFIWKMLESGSFRLI